MDMYKSQVFIVCHCVYLKIVIALQACLLPEVLFVGKANNKHFD
jgi:hypothetical protein